MDGFFKRMSFFTKDALLVSGETTGGHSQEGSV
jgi:hypothetical protein